MDTAPFVNLTIRTPYFERHPRFVDTEILSKPCFLDIPFADRV